MHESSPQTRYERVEPEPFRPRFMPYEMKDKLYLFNMVLTAIHTQLIYYPIHFL